MVGEWNVSNYISTFFHIFFPVFLFYIFPLIQFRAVERVFFASFIVQKLIFERKEKRKAMKMKISWDFFYFHLFSCCFLFDALFLITFYRSISYLNWLKEEKNPGKSDLVLFQAIFINAKTWRNFVECETIAIYIIFASFLLLFNYSIEINSKFSNKNEFASLLSIWGKEITNSIFVKSLRSCVEPIFFYFNKKTLRRLPR